MCNTSEYSESEWNKIRSEFKRIKDFYVDHAGTTLYSEKLLSDSTERLSQNLYCNPHTSKATGDLIDQVRFKILHHFNTSSSKYHVVFCSGTTSALKLIAECFNFGTAAKGHFTYVKDNHTSVLGMRELVNTNNISGIGPDELLNEIETTKQNHDIATNGCRNDSNSLLVLSAQCNFNGYKFPLEVLKYVEDMGLTKAPDSKWATCLDAACFVSTNYLDLNKWSPDFVCMSFYKLFGYPTGIGALLVRKGSENFIQKKYYGGGTVKIAMADVNFHRKKDIFHERLEDGTVPFLSIIALLSGFDTIARLIPPTKTHTSMQRISNHTFQLARYCYQELKALKYPNGNSAIKLYSDTNYELSDMQGGIVNFNVLHSDGSYIGFAEIAYMASIHNIYLRTGCFCNPGACQRKLNLSNEAIRNQFNMGHVCGDTNDLIDGVPTGSVRVSVGYMTSKEDVDAVLNMLRSCYIIENNKVELPSDYKFIRRKPSTRVELKTICVYPIKSCASMKVYGQWPVSSKGLLFDREWMIVDDDGMLLTQKTSTAMCIIRPTIDLVKRTLTLSHPEMPAITIPIDVTADPCKPSISSNICPTKVCQDVIQGVDCGDDVADWISNALNISSLRLLRQRTEDVRYSGNSQNKIALSNQSQYLLINSTSVQWLAEKVDDWILNGLFPEEQLEGVIDRFRGNLVVETALPLVETQWKSVKIGDTSFTVDGPCMRCQMICIDQNSGIKTTEPLKTIAREFKGKMRFGLYIKRDTSELDDDETMQMLKCGDEVTFRIDEE